MLGVIVKEMSSPITAIKSHGEVDKAAKEVYGTGSLILRIGNGGAGATGLIRALSEDYLRTRSTGRIEWVCNHSRNTQLALRDGAIDIALTYERSQEAIAESEGWSRTIGCVFHDHFVLAGPSSDPAGIRHSEDVEAGFSKIQQVQALFHSRADASATMWKERSIWAKSGTKPWSTPETSPWYKESTLSPAEALIAADAAGAYLLTDRSTLLRQTSLGTIHNVTVFLEPDGPDDILINDCYASVASQQGEGRSTHIESFIEYLFGEAGQGLISDFGKLETGHPFFAPLTNKNSFSILAGGLPKNGRWSEACSPLRFRLRHSTATRTEKI